MPNETILVLIFLTYSLVREYFHRQEIQSLIKPPQLVTKPSVPPANPIMETDENEIAYDDPDFDIKKVNKVLQDGQERLIEIQ